MSIDKKVSLGRKNDTTPPDARLDASSSETLDILKTIKGIDQKLLQLKAIHTLVEAANKASHEVLWAEIYNNTVATNDSWLKEKAFSLGRMAIGYPFIYLLFRVLNEFCPTKILEIGLGQSTRMITQYVAAHDKTTHLVVEDNQKWIDFFTNGNNLSDRTKIMHLALEMRPYKHVEQVRTYSGFEKAFAAESFQLIIIDAPFGGDMKEYSRIDILPLLPACLEKSFIIMLDDCERSGERATAAEIDRILQANEIAYRFAKYWGEKDLFVWCSLDNSFFATL